MKKTVEELREEIRVAEEALREEDRISRKAQSAAWEKMAGDPSSWEYMVTPSTYRCWSKDPERTGLRVQMRVKPELLKEFKEGGLSTFSSDYMEEGRWFGMFYYRTEEQILYHDGGGHCALKDVKLCSDEEWERISKGDIPEKFRIR